ncbi:MAG: hypothetical protein GXP27_13305, partial [Planctomycetes bacterium]|nr:hypothetical protein [Planctomycetota bacterium]
MTIGLDIGSHHLRSLRIGPDFTLRARKCRASYAVLPDSPAHQRLLEQAGVSYAVCDGSLLLLGDAALEYANLFQVRPAALLPAGHVPKADPLARQILAALTDSLLPEPDRREDVCCFTSSFAKNGEWADREDEEFFARLIRLKGYAPVAISQSLALVLAELADEAFSGIGAVFGASCSQAVLAHRAVEVARFTLPRGGRWVADELVRRGLARTGPGETPPTKDEDWLLSFEGFLGDPRSAREAAVTELITELMHQLLLGLAGQLQRMAADPYLARPIPLVYAGGLTIL